MWILMPVNTMAFTMLFLRFAAFSIAFYVTLTSAQSGSCYDANSQNCVQYKSNGYCTSASTQIVDYMKRNCQKTCGFCSSGTVAPASCVNSNAHCSYYKQQGYCTSGVYVDFMKANCKQSCGLCGTGGKVTTAPPPKTSTVITKPPVTSGPGSGKGEFACGFDNSLCQWNNEHLDVSSDWVAGVQSIGGPKPAQGSGYLYLDSAYSTGKAKAYLPWNLVLPVGVKDKGLMCMRFQYSIDAGTSTTGLLKVSSLPIRTESDKNPIQKVLFSTRATTNGWRNANVLTGVSTSSTLIIEGVQGLTAGHVAIDNLRFTSGRC